MNDNNSEEENKNSLSMCRNSRIPGNHHRLLIHPKHIYEKLITRPTRQRQIEKNRITNIECEEEDEGEEKKSQQQQKNKK